MFRASNGVWDQLSVTSPQAKQIQYKLRMAMGSTWNPTIDKVFRIEPPGRQPRRTAGHIQVESWVSKEEIEFPNELFGEGRGFTIGPTQPKRFATGRRFDLEQQAKQRQKNGMAMTLYLYTVDIGRTLFMQTTYA